MIDLEKKSYGTYNLFAFTAATIIKESTFVEKLQDKSEFSYSQTATIIIQVFLWSLAYTELFQTDRNILIGLGQKPLIFCNPLQCLKQGDNILLYYKNTRDQKDPEDTHPSMLLIQRQMEENDKSVLHTTYAFGGRNYLHKDFSEA